MSLPGNLAGSRLCLVQVHERNALRRHRGKRYDKRDVVDVFIRGSLVTRGSLATTDDCFAAISGALSNYNILYCLPRLSLWSPRLAYDKEISAQERSFLFGKIDVCTITRLQTLDRTMTSSAVAVSGKSTLCFKGLCLTRSQQVRP